jgi:hypothetical protein
LKESKEDIVRDIKFKDFALGLALLLPVLVCNGCSNSNSGSAGSGSSGGSVLSMAGTWTVQAVSTQNQGSFSGTATVAQSGAGLGNNGTTTFTASVGAIAISETGTALSGMLTNSIKGANYNFIGTLSAGNLTITGSAPCSGQERNPPA